MISNPSDTKTIQKLDAALNKALDEIIQLRKEESHRVMCLKAEITARNAANKQLTRERDILEEGLSQAKAQIATLERIIDIRRDAESVQAEPGSSAVINKQTLLEQP